MRDRGKNLLQFIPDFTVIDLETTGRSNKPEDITEISAIRYRGFKPVASFSTLIKARNKILPFVVNLTGIDDSLLMSKARIEEKIEPFVDFIGDDVILGHNVLFDLNLVESALFDKTGFNMSNDYIDTLRISRLMNHDSMNHKLETLCSYFGVLRLMGHRGEEDCEQTAQIYIKMKDKYERLLKGEPVNERI